MTIDSVQTQADEVSALMSQKLGLHRGSLSDKLRRAGRLLPRRVRADALYLAQASELSENPKLLKMIDKGRAASAYRSCRQHLENIDETDRKIASTLSVLGSIAFSLIVVAALLIAVLRWRGFL